ncbi:Unknown protein, partial [Striga hermonthica]
SYTRTPEASQTQLSRPRNRSTSASFLVAVADSLSTGSGTSVVPLSNLNNRNAPCRFLFQVAAAPSSVNGQPTSHRQQQVTGVEIVLNPRSGR